MSSDMSKVHPGRRYSSEDMYQDYSGIAPGTQVSVERNDVVYTDTISSVSYSSPEPAIDDMCDLNWVVRGPNFVYGPLTWVEAGELSDRYGDEFWVEEIPT